AQYFQDFIDDCHSSLQGPHPLTPSPVFALPLAPLTPAGEGEERELGGHPQTPVFALPAALPHPPGLCPCTPTFPK
ncbi:MAG: hypothetical protein Q8O76_07090, partial [Chloroflexota bacterium]|nr:hypothetical protein [Chloroflexota bacterium]